MKKLYVDNLRLGIAVKLYENKSKLTVSDISNLFNCGLDKAMKLLRQAVEQQAQDKIFPISFESVNTKSAFRAWGLDFERIKEKHLKLKSLGMG